MSTPITDADLEGLAKRLGNKIRVAWVKQFQGKKVQGPYALEVSRHKTVIFRAEVAFSDEAWAAARRAAMDFLQAMLPPPPPSRRPDDNIPLP